MKTTLMTSALISVLALAGCLQAEAPKANADKVKIMTTKALTTKTKAVLIYADWCSNCKVLDPKIKQVQAMGPMPGLKYVTLDYTSKDADDFYAQAEAAGVGVAVKTYLDGTIKTGQLLLVDLDDQKVVGKVTQTLEPAAIAKTLRDALRAS